MINSDNICAFFKYDVDSDKISWVHPKLHKSKEAIFKLKKFRNLEYEAITLFGVSYSRKMIIEVLMGEKD